MASRASLTGTCTNFTGDDGKSFGTFDATDHCDMLQIFKDEGSLWHPPSFTEDELTEYLVLNFPGPIPWGERPVAHGRAWLTKDPEGPAAYYDLMLWLPNGHKLFCLQIGTSAGYDHLGDIFRSLIKQNSTPKKFY